MVTVLPNMTTPPGLERNEVKYFVTISRYIYIDTSTFT